MPINVSEAEVHAALERHHVRYEVRPYYVVWEQRVPGGRAVDQKIQAGFDVDLYGTLGKVQLPLFLESKEAHNVVDYFRMVAHEIQSKIEKHDTTVEVMPYENSLILDTQRHFQPEAMLRIRISHERGMNQPAGLPEEQALNGIREMLHGLKVKEA